MGAYGIGKVRCAALVPGRKRVSDLAPHDAEVHRRSVVEGRAQGERLRAAGCRGGFEGRCGARLDLLPGGLSDEGESGRPERQGEGGARRVGARPALA